MSKIQWKQQTKVGDLYLVATAEGLRGIFWKKQDVPMLTALDESPEAKMIARTLCELDEYFAGKRRNFEIPMDAEGTDFQKKVWRRLQAIPYGQTASYAEIARSLKNEKAVRAVGAAYGRNPISILVPCHRVIGADGKLTGYAGGLKAKEKLLALERGEPI